MMKIIVLVVFLVSSMFVSAEDLMLRVEVQEQQFTDFHPTCRVERADMECIPTHFWFIHRAKVIDVISGEYEFEHINFAMLQHAEYVNESVSDVYILIKEFENQDTIEKLGVENYSERFITAQKIVCIPREFIVSLAEQSKFDTPLFERDNNACFDEENLETLPDGLD